MRSIRASEFKAKCLAILDEVHDTGESVVILKHGRPVARLVPPREGAEPRPQDDLHGSVTTVGDLLEPVLDADAWEAEKGNLP